MSGIVGLVNLDGTPIEPKLLQNLTNFMTYRGSDGQNIWYSGAVGLGNTLLRTTIESQQEHQPISLDNSVWITADARLDSRDELCHKLGLNNSKFKNGKKHLQLNTQKDICKSKKYQHITDAELILHAYQTWGSDCIKHLIGDFSFAIWDSKKQCLFCARDQLGIKQFYYAQIGNCFLFSNTLNCLRQHPLVSNHLNEQAIGDFLLFELNYQPDTTTFADIQRLPPAHSLILSDSSVKIERYWNLPVPNLLRYRQARDYIEHFQQVMALSVTDRLRTEDVAILFSGGLDSTTIAATALSATQKNFQSLNLQGFTVVYDHLIPDEERYYAGLAANALGMKVNYLTADNYQLYQGWNQPQLHTPEPYHEPLAIIDWEQLNQIKNHSRVVLNGQGGDEALFPSTVREMFQGMAKIDVAIALLHCLRYKLRPPLGLGLAAKWRRWRTPQSIPDYYPQWLNPSFAQKLQLRERWQYINNTKPEPIHPFRSQAYRDLISPVWSPFLEGYDAGFSGVPVEVRFPFLDLRLLNYLLAIPPLPWCVDKQLMRIAMASQLPDKVRLRPKTPVAGNPILARLAQGQNPWENLGLHAEINSYVNTSVIRQAVENSNLDSWQAWSLMRPVSLAYWLKQVLSV